MPGIFVSYRREDSMAYAGRVYDHLANHFGKTSVFMDVDTIEPGLDFVDVLQQTVSSCDALVAVIGKNWLTATDEEGRRRLDDPEDLVRLEISAALNRKVRVVPVLVAGARMPRSQELPPTLAPLSRRNALEISDLAFQQSIGRLIDALEKAIQHPPTVSALPHMSEPPRTQPVQSARAAAALTWPSAAPKVRQPPAAEGVGTSPTDPTPSPPVDGSVPIQVTASPTPQEALSVGPLWRRWTLLCRPGGIGGWVFRLVFLLSAAISMVGVGACISGQFRSGGDWVALAVFGLTALVAWRVAAWFDARAARGRLL